MSNIINKIGILPDTNIDTAEIRREKSNEVISFVPRDILSGRRDIKLQKMDVITFYPKWIFNPVQVAGEVENPVIIPYYNGISLLDVMKSVKIKGEARYLKAEIFGSTLNQDFSLENSEASLENLQRNLRSVYLYDLLVKASAEANILLSPGDSIIIKPTFPTEKDRKITILGEVKKPGIYKYKSGMKLYNLIFKAGGYTEDAYPKGCIFIRRSAQRLQQEQINSTLQSMEEHLAKSQGYTSASPEEMAFLQMEVSKQRQLLEIIRQRSQQTLGRIALDIPDKLRALKSHSENIVLIDDDYIFIPATPSYVLVLGDVYNQLSLPYGEGKTLRYYLEQLGGQRKNADVESMYVIRANGKIVSKYQSRSLFNLFFSMKWRDNKIYMARDFDSMILEQGDTIVVPIEVKAPLMWRPLLRDITQIIFQSLATAVMAQNL